MIRATAFHEKTKPFSIGEVKAEKEPRSLSPTTTGKKIQLWEVYTQVH